MSLPIDFEQKIKQQPSQSGYPYQISAADLMQNFVYAAGEFKEEEFEITESTGQSSQHTTRKISLKNSLVGTDQGNIPYWDKNLNDGLGGWSMVFPSKQGHFFYWNTALNNNLGGWQMVPAPTKQGELLFWNKNANNNLGGWELVTATKAGEFLYWNKDAYNGAGGWVPHEVGADGSMIYFSSDSKKWENITPADNSIIYYRSKVWSILTAPASGTYVLGSVDGAMQWIATEEC
jgi:hypothetical protein